MNRPTRSLPKPRSARRSHGRRSRGVLAGGFTLIEVLFALFILLLMGLMVASVIPVAARSTRMANSHSLAVQIVQRKIDQLQDKSAGYAKLEGSSLKSLNIIDSGWTQAGTVYKQGTTVESYGSNYSVTGKFTAVDNLASYFPNGVTGTITVTPWAPAVKSVSGQQKAMLMNVTVTLEWRNTPDGPLNNFSASTLITKMPMN
jgi:hypothetical protein